MPGAPVTWTTWTPGDRSNPVSEAVSTVRGTREVRAVGRSGSVSYSGLPTVKPAAASNSACCTRFRSSAPASSRTVCARGAPVRSSSRSRMVRTLTVEISAS